MYLQKLDLSGRRALVTGAAQGIGLACAQALAEAGAQVLLTDLDADRAEAAAATLRQAGHAARSAGLDATRVADVDALAERLAREGQAIDVLVNNAGIVRSQIPAETMRDADWRDVLDLNLNGVFWCCRAFGRPMLAAGRGAIVNIGSISGLIVNTPQQQASYNAGKAGVHHLTRSLAAEWAPRGVRVNAVAPTYIKTPLTDFADPAMVKAWTDMTPIGRLGEPHEIASVVHFLASDAASLITGEVVVADGGFTCW